MTEAFSSSGSRLSASGGSSLAGDRFVRHALAVCRAYLNGDFVLYMRMYKDAPRMTPYLMDLLLAKLRVRAYREWGYCFVYKTGGVACMLVAAIRWHPLLLIAECRNRARRLHPFCTPVSISQLVWISAEKGGSGLPARARGSGGERELGH